MAKTLDELLHGPSALPILVKPDGTYATAAYPPPTLVEYAPESIHLDWSGDWEDPEWTQEDEQAAADRIENGWEAVTGWSDDGSLFIFRADDRHFSSELKEHIRQTPGLWGIASVEMDPPICDIGEGDMPCDEWTQRGQCEHSDYPDESKAAGWALVHRNRPVKLSNNQSDREGIGFWLVLRDGKETGTHVAKMSRGYHFRAPYAMTPDGFGHRGEFRLSKDDARKDAEEWLTEHIA